MLAQVGSLVSTGFHQRHRRGTLGTTALSAHSRMSSAAAAALCGCGLRSYLLGPFVAAHCVAAPSYTSSMIIIGQTAARSQLGVGGVASFRSTSAAAKGVSSKVSSGDSGATKLVVVESPSKAVKVQKYLGAGYTVLASYGHVRDLVPKSGSVEPDRDFAMRWEQTANNDVMDKIIAAARRADIVLLATDPDREGEAISWHILELLKEEGLVKPQPDERNQTLPLKNGVEWFGNDTAGNTAAITDVDTTGSIADETRGETAGSVVTAGGNDVAAWDGDGGGLEVRRVTFTEVTESAVLAAFAVPREISAPLVDAYLARRALDFLFGFNLSGVLWRKLPSNTSLSAGRVQSVALRLVCEREMAIEIFNKKEFWTVSAGLMPDGTNSAVNAFVGKLTHVAGKKMSQFDLNSRAAASEAAGALLHAATVHTLVVHGVSEKEVKRKPSPPFTTSTLQQEASKQLGFGSSRAMSAAQSLYEGRGWGEGLITYMRTDGLHISPGAVTEIRQVADEEFGAAYVPNMPRIFKKVQKNAQEAHEAIRPTSPKVLPAAVAARLGSGSDEARLYRLIWARAMASQMTHAVTKRIAVDIHSKADAKQAEQHERDGVRLRANGSRLLFPGFLDAYKHGFGGSGSSGSGSSRSLLDGAGAGAEAEAGAEIGVTDAAPTDDRWLPLLTAGQEVWLRSSDVAVVEKDKDAKRGGGWFGAAAFEEGSEIPAAAEELEEGGDAVDADGGDDDTAAAAGGGGNGGVTALQHWTQPPARYTEGSLVKAMEERGIGRPSTYANIIRTITERGYVSKGGGGSGRSPLVPETRGRMVSAFLSSFFTKYVDYGFTAALEDQLDNIAAGREQWKGVLSSFWGPFRDEVDSMRGLRVKEVIDVLDATLGVHFFGDDATAVEAALLAITKAHNEANAAGADSPGAASFLNSSSVVEFDHASLSEARKCPGCATGRLSLKLSRSGGFVGCSNYPSCAHTQMLGPLVGPKGEDGMPLFEPVTVFYPIHLGSDPATGGTVVINNGPYGPYLQLNPPSPTPEEAAIAAAAEAALVVLAAAKAAAAAARAIAAGKTPKAPKAPKAKAKGGPPLRRVGLRNITDKPEDLELESALALLQYPMVLGSHLEDGKHVIMNLGPFGWYVKHGEVIASVNKRVLKAVRDAAVAAVRSGRELEKQQDTPYMVAWEDAGAAGDGGSTEGGAGGDGDDATEAEAETERTLQTTAVLRAQHAPVSLELAMDLLVKKLARPPRASKWANKTNKKKTKKELYKDMQAAKMPAKELKPKRPPSAFMLHCAEARPSLPLGLKVTEQAKLLGAQWKSLGEADRARFHSMAQKDKYAAAAGDDGGGSGSAGAAMKPKRPPSAYFLYCADARSSLPVGLKVTEQAKLLGAQWKSLGEADRARFDLMARGA